MWTSIYTSIDTKSQLQGHSVKPGYNQTHAKMEWQCGDLRNVAHKTLTIITERRLNYKYPEPGTLMESGKPRSLIKNSVCLRVHVCVRISLFAQTRCVSDTRETFHTDINFWIQR